MSLTRAHHATYSFISNNSKKNSDKWAQKIGCDKKTKSNDFIHASEKQFQNVHIFICFDINIGYDSQNHSMSNSYDINIKFYIPI